MLPIYTRYLSPADYGVLHLLQMSLDIASILLSAGVTAGVQRFYFKVGTEREKRAVLVGSFAMLLGFNILGSLGLFLFAPEIASSLLDDPAYTELVNMAATSFILDATLTLPLLLIQVEQRSVLYAFVSITRLVFQLALNIVFVVVLEEGVRGIVISTLTTYIVGGVFLSIWFFKRTGLAWDNRLAWALFKFGLPYRITEAGTFIMTYVDRIFLKAEQGLNDTGIYSLAYQFGFLLMYLGPAPFHLAWDPQRFQLVDQPRAIRNAAYTRGYFYFSVVLVTLAVGICLYVRPALQIMSHESFHWAADIVPLIIIAFLFQAWGHVWEFGIQVSEKTHYTTIATWLAVVVVVVLYWLLIPILGVWGAALATIASYATRWLCFAWFAQDLFHVEYQPGRSIVLALLGAAVVVAGILLSPESLLLSLLVATILAAAWFVLLWYVFLRVQEREAVRSWIRARMGGAE